MQKVDCKELGLISGVEIHQQLDTDKKLFCHCPAGIYTEKHDCEIHRHMCPILNEIGVYDGTTQMVIQSSVFYRHSIIYPEE